MSTTIPAQPATIAVDARPPRRILRGTGAVVAGFLVNVVLGTATDAILHGTGVFPPEGQPMVAALWLLAIGYRALIGVAGCYLTARLAPDRPMRHALALGVLGLLLSTAGTVAMWGQGPAWYALGVIAIVLPSVWIGGRLATR